MIKDLMYVELKTGYSDDGPAWIGYVKTSKTRTAYNMATNQFNFEVIEMIKDLMYVELKTGYSDDGPAWIGYVKTSKTRKTIYFHDHAFQKYNGSYANYVDIGKPFTSMTMPFRNTTAVMQTMWILKMATNTGFLD